MSHIASLDICLPLSKVTVVRLPYESDKNNDCISHGTTTSTTSTTAECGYQKAYHLLTQELLKQYTDDTKIHHYHVDLAVKPELFQAILMEMKGWLQEASPCCVVFHAVSEIYTNKVIGFLEEWQNEHVVLMKDMSFANDYINKGCSMNPSSRIILLVNEDLDPLRSILASHALTLRKANDHVEGDKRVEIFLIENEMCPLRRVLTHTKHHFEDLGRASAMIVPPKATGSNFIKPPDHPLANSAAAKSTSSPTPVPTTTSTPYLLPWSSTRSTNGVTASFGSSTSITNSPQSTEDRVGLSGVEYMEAPAAVLPPPSSHSTSGSSSSSGPENSQNKTAPSSLLVVSESSSQEEQVAVSGSSLLSSGVDLSVPECSSSPLQPSLANSRRSALTSSSHHHQNESNIKYEGKRKDDTIAGNCGTQNHSSTTQPVATVPSPPLPSTTTTRITTASAACTCAPSSFTATAATTTTTTITSRPTSQKKRVSFAQGHSHACGHQEVYTELSPLFTVRCVGVPDERVAPLEQPHPQQPQPRARAGAELGGGERIGRAGAARAVPVPVADAEPPPLMSVLCLIEVPPGPVPRSLHLIGSGNGSISISSAEVTRMERALPQRNYSQRLHRGPVWDMCYDPFTQCVTTASSDNMALLLEVVPYPTLDATLRHPHHPRRNGGGGGAARVDHPNMHIQPHHLHPPPALPSSSKPPAAPMGRQYPMEYHLSVNQCFDFGAMVTSTVAIGGRSVLGGSRKCVRFYQSRLAFAQERRRAAEEALEEAELEVAGSHPIHHSGVGERVLMGWVPSSAPRWSSAWPSLEDSAGTESAPFAQLDLCSTVSAMTLLPHHSVIVAGMGNGKVSAIDPDHFVSMTMNAQHSQKVTAIAAIDTHTFITGGLDRCMALWDLRAPHPCWKANATNNGGIKKTTVSHFGHHHHQHRFSLSSSLSSSSSSSVSSSTLLPPPVQGSSSSSSSSYHADDEFYGDEYYYARQYHPYLWRCIELQEDVAGPIAGLRGYASRAFASCRSDSRTYASAARTPSSMADRFNSADGYCYLPDYMRYYNDNNFWMCGGEEDAAAGGWRNAPVFPPSSCTSRPRGFFSAATTTSFPPSSPYAAFPAGRRRRSFSMALDGYVPPSGILEKIKRRAPRMMTYGHVSGLHSNGLLIAAAVDYNLMCLDIRMLPDCAAIVYSAFGEKNSRALLWHSDQLNILKTGSSGGLVTTWQIT